MANITECDGCGTRLQNTDPSALDYLVMRGQMDDHEFHWCVACSRIAREAVAARRPGLLSDEDRIREAMTEAQDHPGRLITR